MIDPTDKHFIIDGLWSDINREGKSYVAYLFADTPGLIKCGSYTGTGGAGSIECGFNVGWLLIKNTDSNNTNWIIVDSYRGQGNTLSPNNSSSEVSKSGISLPSNAFQLNDADIELNKSGDTYIYVAIAENASAGQFMPTGVLTEDAAGTSMTLTDVTGEWAPGLTAVNETEVTEYAPGADSIVFTSSKPARHLR